jgi:hypothetical protein
LLPLLFLDPLLVGCCIKHHSSSAPLPCSASFSLANFAIPHSTIAGLFHRAPQLLNFASACSLLPLVTSSLPHSIIGWLLRHALLLLLFCFGLLSPCFFAIPHSVASWLLRPVPLLLLLALLPLTSPLLSLPLPSLLLFGCYVAHRFSASLHLQASPLLPLLIPLLRHPLVCHG